MTAERVMLSIRIKFNHRVYEVHGLRSSIVLVYITADFILWFLCCLDARSSNLRLLTADCVLIQICATSHSVHSDSLMDDVYVGLGIAKYMLVAESLRSP